MQRTFGLSKQGRFILLAVIGVAFFVRLGIAFVFDLSDLANYSENGQLAQRMVDGFGYTFPFYGLKNSTPLHSFMPPLYTWVIWFCLTQFNNPALALGIIHVILSTVSLLFIYIFAFKLTSNSLVALLSTTAVSFYPAVVLSITRSHTLTLNIFLISLLLMTSVYFRERPSLLWASFVGITLGITIHSRPMFLLYLPILASWLWINTDGNKKQLIRAIGVTTIWMFILLIPWTIRNYIIHQELFYMSTNGGFNLWSGNNKFTTGSGHEVYSEKAYAFLGTEMPLNSPPIQEMHQYPLPAEVRSQLDTITELEFDKQLYAETFNFIKENPRQWSELLITKFKSFVWFRGNIGARYEAAWTQYYKYLYALVLILFSVGVVANAKNWKMYSLLYGLFIYYTIFYTLFHVQTRYRWEIEPFILIFSAIAIVKIGERIGLKKLMTQLSL